MGISCYGGCYIVRRLLPCVILLGAFALAQLPQRVVGNDWSTNCSANCTCKWTNGKKSAICNSLKLSTIPTTLSTELQVLVLNDNHIPYINREEFTKLGLLNLQRIYLKKSEIQYIHKETFKNLRILVEIDLSENKIEMLDKDTFMGNDRLRILYLNGNPLKRLAAYQFPILPHLRTLDLHDCLISYIDPMALANLNMLEFLYLKNNLLESLSEYVFQHMTNLKTLIMDENPWQCNCKLRKFRNWYVRSKVNSIGLLCKGPPSQKERTWEQVDEEQFGCAPKVEIFNNEDVQNIDIGSNTTFSCLVYGDPLPDVRWELNGKLLDNDNVMFDTDSISSDKLWSNVSVFNMTSLDAGTYACTGVNIVGTASQNISIYLTEIVQHVLVKTPETFWYFGLIMGTFGTIFLLIFISFVVCLCKRTTRQRRHPNKSGVKTSVSFNDQEKKLLDLSITTTTADRGDSCGIDNNTTNSISKTDSVIGFEPIEIHTDNHRGGSSGGLTHAHHSSMLLTSHSQQLQQHHAQIGSLGSPAGATIVNSNNNRQQLIAVADGSCNVVGIPTSMASSVSAGHPKTIPEEFPLNVGVFPPPPEFCSNIVPNPTYGNIFISVSVTQDMLESGDLNMYPDLLNIPKRLQINETTDNQDDGGSATTGMPPLASSVTAPISISSFATLPRNTQRRGILKKDSSLQHTNPPQSQALQQTNLYPHDEIVSYHNLETSYSQGYQDHQQQQDHHAASAICLPPSVTATLTQCLHSQNGKVCIGCMNEVPPPPSACNTPPITSDTTPLHPLCQSSATAGSGCLKYDNMGRRITASGNSTLSLPDEERLESETLFNDGAPLTKTITVPNSITALTAGNSKQLTQSCNPQDCHQQQQQLLHQQLQHQDPQAAVTGGVLEYVSL